MKLLDFLFYYFTIYFTKRRETLRWSTPEERSAYAMALMVMSWLIALTFFIVVDILKTNNFKGEYVFISVPVGVLSMWFFKSLYIRRGRYEFLKENKNGMFDISDNWGILISWILLLISFVLPATILFLNMK